MKSPGIPRWLGTWFAIFACWSVPCFSAEKISGEDPAIYEPLPPALNEVERGQVTASVDLALEWLRTQAEADGSFATSLKSQGQPALTSLAIMAFLSRGHRPGSGPYGELLNRAIDFALSCQQDDGIFCYRNMQPGAGISGSQGSQPDTYNHAITMLMLGEVYGMTSGERTDRIQKAIEKGLMFDLQLWRIQEKPTENKGGWRYVERSGEEDSDLSVTAWYAVSLRSIKNAGFDVPEEIMAQVLQYVDGLYRGKLGGFIYRTGRDDGSLQVAMTGAGILCLALGGKYQNPGLLNAAETLAKLDYQRTQTYTARGTYYPYYTSYYVTQAAAQIGGSTWVTLYRGVAKFLLPQQERNGAWPPQGAASRFGPVYSTSMAVLSLATAFQMLPIYQR